MPDSSCSAKHHAGRTSFTTRAEITRRLITEKGFNAVAGEGRLAGRLQGQLLRLTGYSSENLTGADLREDMLHICSWLEQGKITAPETHHFPLAETAQVHAGMERRELVGRNLLLP